MDSCISIIHVCAFASPPASTNGISCKEDFRLHGIEDDVTSSNPAQAIQSTWMVTFPVVGDYDVYLKIFSRKEMLSIHLRWLENHMKPSSYCVVPDSCLLSARETCWKPMCHSQLDLNCAASWYCFASVMHDVLVNAEWLGLSAG